MNWGYGIIIVFAVFVSGMAYMVIESSKQKIDLVTEDYYGKEIKFQQQIDELNRTNNLSQEVVYKINENEIEIKFPKDFSGKKITGVAELYCPSNNENDITQSFTIKDSILIFKLTNKNRGLNELHINWQSDNTSYYFEKKITL